MNTLDPPVNPGDQLDHYQIESVVVRSDVGTMFRAIDLRTHREVAIKVPNPELEADPIFADRFLREREIAERLDHPGMMKVIPDGDHTKPYIVMEWFDGKLLLHILAEEKKLDPQRAVRIAIGICEALEYLHGQGIVHGDLRPATIMVGNADDIKLIDLSGVVKSGARRLTFAKLSQVSGTSEYISPEELKGKRGDARSDIYALGIILYEMLTGRLPFQGTEPFDRISNHIIPPREIDASISPQLQEVIYRALEQAPPNRYSSAHEFANDLEHLDQIGIAERPELREWKKKRAVSLNMILFYGAIALIPVLIVSLLLYFARSH